MSRGPQTVAGALLLAAVPVLCTVFAERASAGEGGAPWRETWAGAIASPKMWSAYSGVTFAPFGSIEEDGFRFRSVGGYGKYSYSYVKSARTQSFKGTTAFTDLLAGWQHTLGPATIKGFVGGAAIGHVMDGYDPLNQVQGLDYGLKVGLETWVNLGPRAFNQLDIAWTAAFDSVNARSRTGYRVLDGVSVGLELSASSNAQLKSEWLEDKPWRGGSGGAFVRYEWTTGEVSASAGLGSQGGSGASSSGVNVGAGLGSIAKPTTPYATVNWLKRF